MSITDSFIQTHNRSLTQGVSYMTLHGAKDYSIILDARTHSLYLFTNSSIGQQTMVQANSKGSVRKLMHTLRDKFNEAERTFVPSYFNNLSSYNHFNETYPTELRPATIMIKNNRVTYSTYPIFCAKKFPVLTLLLRVKQVFDFITSQSDWMDYIMSPHLPVINKPITSDVPQQEFDWSIDKIVDRSGCGVLSEVTCKKISSVTVSDIMPKIESLIDFTPFNIISDMKYIVRYSELKEIFNSYQDLPKYIIVEVDVDEPLLSGNKCPFRSYQVQCVITTSGTIYERFNCIRNTQDNSDLTADSEVSYEWLRVNGRSYTKGQPSEITHILLTNGELLSSVAAQPIKVIGQYERSDINQDYVMPFRNPLTCKQSKIGDKFPYPIYAQRKLDGNRVIVYSLFGGRIVRFYSRSGYELSRNFNSRFSADITKFSRVLCEKLSVNGCNVKHLHLDFECYDHGTIHSTIAGLCNAIECKSGFEKLQLHLLSCFDLEDIYDYEERKRKYTASNVTLQQSLELCQWVDMTPYDTLTKNETRLVNNDQELGDFMKESVYDGYEGLVLYPLNSHYVFGHDRLFKIKKVYDGEVKVLGFKESDIEPGAIGSVLVESRPNLGIRVFTAYAQVESNSSAAPVAKTGEDEFVQYYVTASLKLEFKSGSYQSALFKQCIGKYFTIVCDSFSDTGIPQHSRFKQALHPDTARLDIDHL